MKCPRCESSLLDERDRDGLTIDVCRECRGVWLDRGELEKLVARAAREMEDHHRGQHHGDRDSYDEHTPPGGWRTAEGGRPLRRKRSWFETLGDIFD